MNTLYKAIQHNDFQLFRESISSPEVDVNKQNSKGRTPLLHCLKRQRSDRFILALLESKCDVTLSDRNRTTPLFVALTDRRLTIASDDPDKKQYNLVGLNLVQYSLGLRDPDIFRLVWPSIDHRCMFDSEPAFLRRYFDSCIFSGDEFDLCLDMIMSSPLISTAFSFYKNKHINQSFYFDLLNAYARRSVEVERSRLYMIKSLWFISVDAADILAVYGAFGIDRETLFLVDHFERQGLTNNECNQKLALEFLKHLENNNKLELDEF
ncbi:hypothetical protein ILUMI_07126 [Ignelater luminosus]|uniref:Uncharacterized protein n=1 Tax=Ignelater luminosus TaxID=2038154 RepID=A0A8K0D8W8_IGNLU|nr:hypothetical protein ILUMI_07126 [Ignelater luminosus]